VSRVSLKAFLSPQAYAALRGGQLPWGAAINFDGLTFADCYDIRKERIGLI